MSTLGERIKQIRGKKSQDQFARDIGIAKNSLGFYEREERTPNATTIAAIVERLDISPDWLLFGEGPMRRNQSGEVQDSASPLARSKMFAGASFAGETLGPSANEELSYLRKEVRELRDENRDLRNENMELRKENRELRKIEAEYFRLKPDKDDSPEGESTRKSA